MKRLFFAMLLRGFITAGLGNAYADESVIDNGNVGSLDLTANQKTEIDRRQQQTRTAYNSMNERSQQNRESKQTLMASENRNGSESQQRARYETRNQVGDGQSTGQKHQWQHQRQNRHENNYKHANSSQRGGGKGNR